MSPEHRCPKGEVPLYTMFFKVLQQDSDGGILKWLCTGLPSYGGNTRSACASYYGLTMVPSLTMK